MVLQYLWSLVPGSYQRRPRVEVASGEFATGTLLSRGAVCRAWDTPHWSFSLHEAVAATHACEDTSDGTTKGALNLT